LDEALMFSPFHPPRIPYASIHHKPKKAVQMRSSPITCLLVLTCCCAFGNAIAQFQLTRGAYLQPNTTAFIPDGIARQEVNDKPVQFGLKGGISLSNMNFNKGHSGVNVPLDRAWKAGLSLGLVMQVYLSGRLFLVQEYSLSRIRGGYAPYEAEYTLDYASFPILLHYRASPKIGISAGPQLEILLYGREKILNKSSAVTKMIEERSLGMMLGVDYSLSGRIKFSARFMHGLNHIGIYQRTDRREFKYELVQASTNILF
jgi:hypothetical protein